MPAVVAAAAVGAVGRLEPELELELLLVLVLELLDELGAALLLVVVVLLFLLLPQPVATRASTLTAHAAIPRHRKEPFTCLSPLLTNQTIGCTERTISLNPMCVVKLGHLLGTAPERPG